MAQGLTPTPLSVQSAMQHCGRVRDQHGDIRRHYASEVRLKKKNIKPNTAFDVCGVQTARRTRAIIWPKVSVWGIYPSITWAFQTHLNYSHFLIKTLTALEPATSHFMRTEGSSRWQRSHTAALDTLFQTFQDNKHSLYATHKNIHFLPKAYSHSHTFPLYNWNIEYETVLTPRVSSRRHWLARPWDTSGRPNMNEWLGGEVERERTGRGGMSWCCSFLGPTWTRLGLKFYNITLVVD